MATKNHLNLVRLLGFCKDYDAATGHMEQILVYEFMENGDLEAWIGPGDVGIGPVYEFMENGDLEAWIGPGDD
ncbi:unnamed protein product [Closterium sp. Naga37s-1]|nr:unnamed protein product [Closterium sp. Naga37s-1]